MAVVERRRTGQELDLEPLQRIFAARDLPDAEKAKTAALRAIGRSYPLDIVAPDRQCGLL